MDSLRGVDDLWRGSPRSASVENFRHQVPEILHGQVAWPEGHATGQTSIRGSTRLLVMTNNLFRPVAAAGAAVLLSVVGALAVTDAAHAVDLTGPSWDNGVDVHLSSVETTSAVSQGIYATGSMCTQAINQAIQGGVVFPDAARTTCAESVAVCARDARVANRALSATRLYADGTHKCLVV